MRVEGCGSDSLQGDVRFAEVMGLMGATVQWEPHAITITGARQQLDCVLVVTLNPASSAGLCMLAKIVSYNVMPS